MIKFESGIEIYHNTGDTLPTEGIPASSIALNMDDWTVSIYNGVLWVPKGSKMVETELVNGTFAFTENASLGLYTNNNVAIELTEGKTYKVTLDGAEYETVCQVLQGGVEGIVYIGSSEFTTGVLPSTMPFAYTYNVQNGYTTFVTTTGNNHDIIIKTYEVQGV